MKSGALDLLKGILSREAEKEWDGQRPEAGGGDIAAPCMFPVSTCLRLIRTSGTGTDKMYYASSGSRLGFISRICVEEYVARFCIGTGTSELPSWTQTVSSP